MDPSTVPGTSRWQRFTTTSVRLFHEYASWLAGLTWKRFFLLSFLLLVATGILSKFVPGSWTVTEVRDAPAGHAAHVPHVPRKSVAPPAPPAPTSGKPTGDVDVTISIDKNGVSIKPRMRSDAASAAQPGAASGASEASPTSPASANPPIADVEIKLPPGATSEAVRQAVEEARTAVIEAIEESRQAEQEAAQEAAQGADSEDTERQVVRTRLVRAGDSLTPLAFVFILMSAILKITYKGRIQAEVKAAAATETAESEQLKRQVVEARMAAMQAQVEPHFLFNTLASIDHLIETDPPRASTMQKNLIALLRASMPAMREAHPSAHNLGREMAVIRPYLEILKVRMEDRLKTEIQVPDGLLSADFPAMMIQSLVENAIKHGLEPKPEGGTLTVRAEIVHGKLAVTIADTGLGFGKAETAGTGIGLANIRERLQLLFGNRASMTVSENTPTGTIVTLTVPYLAQPRDGESP